MRILYVINGFDPGGAEHGLLTLLQNRMFERHEIRVLALCRGRGTLVDRVASAVGPSNLEIVSSDSVITMTTCARTVAAIARIARSWKPDVMVLSMKQANVVGRFAACFLRSVHCVSFEHIARYRAQRAEWVYGYLLWLLSSRVDEVWADCDETHRATAHYFRRRSRRQATVPLFQVDADCPPKHDYHRSGPLRIVGAGRLVGRKNFAAVIEACRRLNEEGLPTELDIIGEGPDRDDLQRAIDAHGMTGRIRLVGYRPNWYVEARDYDVFVNASDTEGFCIVVAEAMSIGLPVVATDVGGVREYGESEDNMIKVQSGEAGELAAALRRVAMDADLRMRIGTRARQAMVARYSLEVVRQRYQSVIAWATGPQAVRQ